MKTIFSLSLFFPLLATAASMASIEMDQSIYDVGAKAMAVVHIDRVPENKGRELFLRFRLDGQEVKATFLSNRLAVAFLPRFKAAGTFDLELDVYYQNRSEQRALEKTIALYQEELFQLRLLLGKETDPEARIFLENEIQLREAGIAGMAIQMEKNRFLVELDHADVVARPALKNLFAAPGIFTLRADEAGYNVGQKAKFYARLLTEFTGPSGPKETLFRGQTLGQNLVAFPAGEELAFQSATLTIPQLGAQVFEATLFVRPKAQSDLLRSLKTLTLRLRSEYTKERDQSYAPGLRAYYQVKINELTALNAELGGQLEAILLEVASDSLSYTVVNP